MPLQFKNSISEIVSINPFAKKVGTILLGSGAAQLLNLAAVPFLTRVYDPENFGEYGIYLSMLAIIGVFATWRYERGIVITKSASERHGLLMLILLISLALSALVFLIVTIAPLAKLEDLTVGTNAFGWKYFLAAGLFFLGAEMALRHLAISNGSFSTIAAQVALGTLVLVSVQLITGLLNVEGGLVVGHMAFLIFGFLWLAFAARREEWVNFKRYRPKLQKAARAAARMREFPKFMVWSALCNSTTPQAILIVINFFFSPATAGQIFLAERIVKSPLKLLGRAVAQVNFEETSKLGRGAIKEIYLFRMKRFSLLGALPFLILFWISPYLFPLVFGSAWSEAGIFAQIITPAMYVQIVFSPFIDLFTVLRLQRQYLIWSIARLALVVSGIAIGACVGGAAGAVMGYSIALSIGYLAGHFILMRALNRGAT